MLTRCNNRFNLLWFEHELSVHQLLSLLPSPQVCSTPCLYHKRHTHRTNTKKLVTYHGKFNIAITFCVGINKSNFGLTVGRIVFSAYFLIHRHSLSIASHSFLHESIAFLFTQLCYGIFHFYLLSIQCSKSHNSY